MRYPKLQPMGSSRLVTDRFLGYDHRLRIGEGEFYETQNLTTKHYPLMASRDPRGTVDRSFTKLQAIIAKDKQRFSLMVLRQQYGQNTTGI